MECKESEYYRGTLTGSLYKVFDTQMNDGTIRKTIQRFNWDQKNWSGHQHNPELTRIQIETLTHIEKINKEEVIKLTKDLK
jgi:hypothetical protein